MGFSIFIFVAAFPSIYSIDINPIKPPVGCENYALCANNNYDPSYTSYYQCMPGSCTWCNNGTSYDIFTYLSTMDANSANCALEQNKCTLLPCLLKPHSTCIQHIDNYECQCQPGWTGSDCNTPASPCDSSPCRNGGTCTKVTASTFTCDCGTDAMGERCQYKNDCKVANPCQNGATCVMLFSGEQTFCNCTAGWQGASCQLAILKSDDTLLEDCTKIDEVTGTNTTKKTKNQPSQSWCRGELQTAVAGGKNYQYYCQAGQDCYLYSTLSGLSESQGADYCDNKCYEEANPNKADYWGANDTCGSSKAYGDKPRGPCYQYSDIVDLTFCTPTTCSNGGVCQDLTGNKTGCLCSRDWRGTFCDTPRYACGPGVNPCQHGGKCRNTTGFNFYECDCDVGWTGQDCEIKLYCQTKTPDLNPCKYGGMCIEKDDHSGFTCDCLSRYTGNDCGTPNMCLDFYHQDPCYKGNCTVVVNGDEKMNSSFTCTCEPGWTDELCDTPINFCLSPPCKWGGTCRNVRVLGIPTPPYVKCDCQAGTSGEFCENNPDDCPFEKCNKTDKAAICIDGFGTYHCQCGPDYTAEFCDIPIPVYNAITLIFGPNAAVSEDIINLLKDLLSNPTNIKDMVPFILGLETEDDRADKSWDYSDMFRWVAYEEKALDLPRDLLKWNDVTLGNCFTFNHRNNTKAQYLHRLTGKTGSLEAMLSVNSEENCPWVDTQAIQVFVHPAEEDIFSESVRYNAQPGGEAQLFPKLTAYQRLGGRYGICVTETNQVEQYFYSGAYATDGCLRSCYQKAVQESCGCMDPRYPMDKSVDPCPLTERSCVERVATERGDPSKWDNCTCPLPCSNRAYTVSWAKSVMSARKPQCVVEPGFNYSACRDSFKDTVRVRVVLTDFTFQLFTEVPAMSFNSFIGNLGGLLGVLMGISTISFIEIGFLLIAIVVVLLGCSKKKR